MTPYDPVPWIALRLCGVGKVYYKRLVLRFGGPEEVFRAPEAELARVDGARPQFVRAIREFRGWETAREALVKAGEAGSEVVVYPDARYPANLREIHDPPPYLYVRGSLLEEDRVSVAVVGSRAATPHGVQLTRKIARELSARGITVVSGGARGIDTEAHRGAIEGGGRTIAVLGCGIDVVYPSENREVFEKIAGQGAVVTEYPPGTPPDKTNFPPRNRLISGISLGVLVMEAADDSGWLITASCALDQGREIYAVPGGVGQSNSRGTNNLIKKGARLVEGADDILLDLFPYLKGYLKGLDLDGERAAGPKRLDLDAGERTLYELITIEPVHVDDLSAKAGLPVSRALSLLLTMELKGAVKQLPGMRFIREL